MNHTCPKCGGTTLDSSGVVSTCLGWNPVVVDGVRHSHDPNCHHEGLRCRACKHWFKARVLKPCPAPGCTWKPRTSCSVCKD